MARIHSPRQRESDKRWDFTVASDEEHWCHATGYCAGWEDPDEVNARLRARFGDDAGLTIGPEEAAKKRQFQTKFHKDGHATAKEASDCHDEYELDFEVRVSENPEEMLKCASCGDFTTGRVRLGTFDHFTLCSAHQTKDDVKKAREAARAERQATRL